MSRGGGSGEVVEDSGFVGFADVLFQKLNNAVTTGHDAVDFYRLEVGLDGGRERGLGQQA